MSKKQTPVNGENEPATKGDVDEVARVVNNAITTEVKQLDRKIDRLDVKIDGVEERLNGKFDEVNNTLVRMSDQLDHVADAVVGLPERVEKLEHTVYNRH